MLSEKYRPKSLSELPQKGVALELKKFAEVFPKTKKKAVLLYGPAGSCKTSAVYALAEDLSFEVMEVNASDFRNSEQLNSRIGNASKQKSLFHKGKIILVDEVDGISGQKDRGGLSALLKIIDKSAFPIILTANDPWNSKFSSLRRKCLLVECRKLNYLTIHNILKNVCEKENIPYEEPALKTLARTSGGDLRAAINDLQRLGENIRMDSVKQLPDRFQEESMFQALTKIFKSNDFETIVSALDNVGEDLDKAILWLEDNIPAEYQGIALSEAFDYLSKANVFLGRIRKSQYWRFLYHARLLMLLGVGFSKTSPRKSYTKYYPPQRILKIWRSNQKTAKKKAEITRLAKLMHCSNKKALSSYCLFSEVAKKRKSFREEYEKVFE